MAIRSRFYLHLAVALNCLILAFLILDSRSIQSLDINVGLFPDRWDQDGRGWINTATGGMKEESGGCGMCRGNLTLCNEVGYVVRPHDCVQRWRCVSTAAEQPEKRKWIEPSGLQDQANG